MVAHLQRTLTAESGGDEAGIAAVGKRKGSGGKRQCAESTVGGVSAAGRTRCFHGHGQAVFIP